MQPVDPRQGRAVRVVIDHLTLHRDDRAKDTFTVIDSVGNIFVFRNDQARYEFVDGRDG